MVQGPIYLGGNQQFLELHGECDASSRLYFISDPDRSDERHRLKGDLSTEFLQIIIIQALDFGNFLGINDRKDTATNRNGCTTYHAINKRLIIWKNPFINIIVMCLIHVVIMICYRSNRIAQNRKPQIFCAQATLAHRELSKTWHQ